MKAPHTKIVLVLEILPSLHRSGKAALLLESGSAGDLLVTTWS